MPTELMESLGEQLAGYEELARIAGEQLARILEEDTQGFDRAAARREGLQKRIAACEERIGRVLQSSPGLAARVEVLDVRKKIKRLASDIRKTDGQAFARVEEMRDEAARRLDRFKRGRKGLKGYGRGSRSAPRFVDRKG